ncbi:MAG: acyl-CoA dehydrogenase family protein [Dehalococcoidia bacterium]
MPRSARAAASGGGGGIDQRKVHTERLAYLATQVRAAHELVAYAERLDEQHARRHRRVRVHLRGRVDAHPAQRHRGSVGRLRRRRRDRGHALHRGCARGVRAGLAHASRPSDAPCSPTSSRTIDLEDEVATLTRDAARDFARNEVVPRAQQIHREDLIVPDDLIQKFAAQGFFGSSISRGVRRDRHGRPAHDHHHRGAVGGLARRGRLAGHAPRDPLEGPPRKGTDEQKREWLPRIASGETLVAIAVTEPDVGSDVASLQTHFEPAERGRRGWRLNGAKAWSTFSGRANVLALLARTDPDSSRGNRGLSLFIVPKDAYPRHQWRYEQPEEA